MFQKIFSFALIIFVLVTVPAAFAGKVELTTYYPAPYGEYSELQASTKLKVPVVSSGAKTTSTVGEIWVECPAGQTWNGNACV